MVKKIDHIGIAVFSIADSAPFYADVLGLGEPKIEVVKEQKVKTAMFTAGDVRIELLEPVSDDSPISNFLKKRGEGIHHIAYLVDDISGSIRTLEKQNVGMINKEAREGTEGQLIAFLHPKSTFGVLTELCQMKTRSE